MSVNVFVDTNIFVYAHVSGVDAKHDVALDLLRNLLVNKNIYVSTQVLGEFYVSMVKYKRAHNEISRFMQEIIRDSNVIDVSLTIVEHCLRLRKKYGYSYWDSLILAAADASNCEVVYTEDMQHDQRVEDRLIIKNPFLL